MDQADALIGTVGSVVNPAKGRWDGEYRVLGYDLDPDDQDVVRTLRLESVARVPERRLFGPKGPTGEVVPEHPAVVAHAVPCRWFRPAEAVEPKRPTKTS